MLNSKANTTDIPSQCGEARWDTMWLAIDAFILVTGGVANVALLWLFLRERKSLSASQVLGLNLVVMDLIFLTEMPINMIYPPKGNVNRTQPEALWVTTPKHPLDLTSEVFSMLNLVGCPLLLACMCAERCLAVVRPVLYLRVRRWEYRMAVSAVVWVFTCCFCLATGLVRNVVAIMQVVSIIIVFLFCLMLLCLGAVIWSLQKPSPALQPGSGSPLKRRALDSVLLVVLLAVVAYLPVMVFVPMVFYFQNTAFDGVFCIIFELMFLTPVFGVFIGPLFYLSKARQMCCLGKTGKTVNQ
ncbi:putative P2Y purinoceptor 10 [Liparis tanakae]|uniref:Putative P2Y purinoceptor 10 n=1 Tax=Liparis tanakae TaxID=230148 RepID=A0A4Z2F5M7_9TELE|nr:putative P2Y purinoceptor 10 [Liparis tanakae]